MARLTIPAVSLVLDGTGFKVGAERTQKGRTYFYWLEGPDGAVPETRTCTLANLLGIVHALGIA